MNKDYAIQIIWDYVHLDHVARKWHLVDLDKVTARAKTRGYPIS